MATNSTYTVQSLVDNALVFAELAPALPAGGFSDQPALSIANDVMSAMLLGGAEGQPFNWKWNRFQVTPFTTISYQSDYFVPGLTNLGWIESAWTVDINNSSIPKPKFSMECHKDLLVSYIPGNPFKICWLPVDQCLTGTWGEAPLGPSGTTATSYSISCAATIPTATTYTLDLGASTNGVTYVYSISFTNTANAAVSISASNAITSNQVIVNAGATETLSGTFTGDGSTHITFVFGTPQSNTPISILVNKLPYFTANGASIITNAQQTFASGWVTNTSAVVTPGTIAISNAINLTGLQNPGAGVVYTNPVGAVTQPLNATTCIKDGNGNFWVLTTFGTCGNTEPSWPTNPVFQTSSTAATTVVDGTCVWTAIDPKGQGFRLNPIPPQAGIAWTIQVVGQKIVPKLTSFANTLDPVPDDFYTYFKQGFFAECYRYSPDPKVRAKYPMERSIWMEALNKAVKQGDREMDDFGFYPGSSIMNNGLWPFIQPTPAYPYASW